MRIAFLYCLLIYTCLSCRKIIDIGEPSDKMAPEEVYSSDSGAIAVMAGIYSIINSSELSAGGKGIAVFCALYADELSLMEGNQEYQRCYENTLSADDSPFWSPLYRCIQHCNMLLNGLEGSNRITPAVKQQLTGEAKCIRAFCYFYLVNFFGDVPLLTTTDLHKNTTAGRSSTESVYDQIADDLQDAISLLREEYLGGDAQTMVNERLRPNKWAAVTLLARVHLYRKNWAAAEQEASNIIARNRLYAIPALKNAFAQHSPEMIWALENTTTTGVNEDAALLVLQNGPDREMHPLFMNKRLLQRFEKKDQRLVVWIGTDSTNGSTYYYPYKYRLAEDGRSPTPYLAVLRLAEVFLIRAEAKVYINDFAGARADLMKLRQRAGLGYVVANSRTALLKAIEQERRVELFTEWGHRWLDLKRYERADEIMYTEANTKGTTWMTYKQFFPIPYGDMVLNPALKQNEGY
ncbi:RagB/SusD family nutrient uptake outer membrane protein [Chitinophaga ginsengisoli]|uniref:SusD-like starch-binding protein associating with outer membrane n=1 Tax=Chitinophaga ginsengisoli TaxID=363837 RepID=A0A2P8GHZ0_9BACT|nr:RagB/SusD family nutrient uptake outer membrane protein [Chitinophaga ginsengisoli]PSL33557.1 SusD-like starch-binding protein associating with outer membrane [Chitinophaga ginsengisoli]